MPIIDASSYVDLTLYDADAQTIIDRALEWVSTKFPEWTPHEHDLGVVLIEAFATEVVETVYAINRVPSATLEAYLALLGITASKGVAPTGTAAFQVATDTIEARTIPAGTRIALGDTILTTTTDGTAAATPGGATTATVTVPIIAGDTLSSALNGTTGQRAQLVDSVANVTSVTVTTLNGGKEPEGTDAFLSRATTYLKRMTSTLVTAEQIATAALENPAVVRVAYRDNTTGASVTFGGSPGHVALWVAGAGGAALSDAQTAELKANLEAQSVANLTLHVFQLAPLAIDVSATVVVARGYAAGDVTAAVQDALTKYLSADTFNGEMVYYNELISLIDRVDGVDRVVSLTTPSGDVRLTVTRRIGGQDQLSMMIPTPGVLTITAQGA